MQFTIFDLEKVYKACSENENAIKHSKECGCFHCITFFAPDKITQWRNGQPEDASEPVLTAICPNCGMESVLPDSLYFNLDQKLLKEMHQKFF
jgi:hypothetical protein